MSKSSTYLLPLGCIVLPAWSFTNEPSSRKSSMPGSPLASSPSKQHHKYLSNVNSDALSTNSNGSEHSDSVTSHHSSHSFTQGHFTQDFGGSMDGSTPLWSLRERFELYLKKTLNRKENPMRGDALIQKLLFLDEFYDPIRHQVRRIESEHDLFDSCNRLIAMMVKPLGMVFGDDGFYPYLLNIEAIEKSSDLKRIPLLSQHQFTMTWLKEQRQLAVKYKEKELTKQQQQRLATQGDVSKDFDLATDEHTSDKVVTSIKEIPIQYEGLKLLIFMMSEELEDLFSLFQKENTNHMKRWLEENIVKLPRYILELIQKKHKRYLHFHDTFRLTEEDFNVKTLLDADFNFVHYLCEYTEDWKLSYGDSPNNLKTFKSRENYSKLPDMKMLKIITHLDYSIEKCAKALLNGDVGDAAGQMMSTKYHAYQSLDLTHSTRKYSSVIQTSLFDYGSMFRKRALENAVSSKAVFMDGKLAQFYHIFKTCSFVNYKTDTKTPLKIITVGGRIFTRIDTNYTRVIDVKMFNVGGFMNSDLVIHSLGAKKISEDLFSFFTQKLKQDQERGFPTPDAKLDQVWRTFAEYCSAHCNTDVNQL